MNCVYIREKLSRSEADWLALELQNAPLKLKIFDETTELDDEEWSQVEILYSKSLTPKELEKAYRLRWIHVPQPELHQVCVKEIAKLEHLHITFSNTVDPKHVVELVTAGILIHAKNLPTFACIEDTMENQDSIDLARSKVMDINNKHFLQIGLDEIGTAIAKKATEFGMHVWGVETQPTFHPHCRKVFPRNNLNAILPKADIVCLTPQPFYDNPVYIGKKEIEHMKEGAILLILCANSGCLDADALAEACKKDKVHGVMLDMHQGDKISPTCPLKQLPNVIITPNVAPLPEPKENLSLRAFRNNLRLFLQGSLHEMEHLVNPENR